MPEMFVYLSNMATWHLWESLYKVNVHILCSDTAAETLKA